MLSTNASISKNIQYYMLLSMTGYGRSTIKYKDKSITVEIRSLNSKYTDLRIKLPQMYREKESDLRKLISDKVERGKIDFTIETVSIQGEEEHTLNIPLFKKYHKDLYNLSQELNIVQGDIVHSILRLPNVVTSAAESLEEEEWAHVMKAIHSAFEHFDQYRLAEGAAMEKDLRLRVNNIETHFGALQPFEAERIEKLRQRLYQNLEEYLSKDKIDENRFEQEIMFYLEKIDITEEKVRLIQHCKYFIEELDKSERLKGRKLSFIGQEIGREINTMGAKAYSHGIQRIVVNMKDELEKIKEQVANSV